MTVLICLLLLASAAWSIDPPDSVWVESVEYDEALGGSVTLGFLAVEGADGYRIYRMVTATDSLAWVSWATVTDAIQDTIRVRVATLDNDSGSMGVGAFVIEDGKEILSEMAVAFVEHTGDMGRAVPTAVRKSTWGQVKADR